MLHAATFRLDLHCLPKTLIPRFQSYWIHAGKMDMQDPAEQITIVHRLFAYI